MLRTGVVALALLIVHAARGQEAYYHVPLADLTIVEGALPRPDPEADPDWRMSEWLQPRASLDDAGEAYVVRGSANNGQLRWGGPWQSGVPMLVARAPAGAEVTGWVYLPDPEYKTLVPARFALDPARATADARREFHAARATHYEELQQRGFPGGAWFRRRADESRRILTTEFAEDGEARPRFGRPGRELRDTYDLFTGGRAVAENLQLDRDLPEEPVQPNPEAVDVPVASIDGITIAAIDWSAHLGGGAPEPDPLAAGIPADQHAVFFPSFEALAAALDETRRRGLPVFRTLSASAEDSRVIDRYERQLGLSTRGLAGLLGPRVVRSIALTGSDPYFATGTDVALLFESDDPDALALLLLAQVSGAASAAEAALSEGEAGGVRFTGGATADRSFSSYVARVGRAAVVTNSLAQLRRLALVQAGEAEPVAALDEYRVFRARHPRSAAGETAFLFLSDPTIRRWCGPEWRIGASRRLRAAAIMADMTAARLHDLAAGVPGPRPVEPEVPMRTIGQLTLGPSGVSSSVYGSPGFLTPIVELDITAVARDEANAYRRWRQGYQREWGWAFDPIGASIALAPERLSADLTVMPLIAGTDYRPFVQVVQGATLAPGAGDPHDALVQFAMAINVRSPSVQQAGMMARMFAQGVDIDPFGWLGQSLSVYLDNDPVWAELRDAADPREFLESEAYRLPIGLYAEASSALKLTAFVAGVRAFLDQTAPGMTAWEPRTHGEQPYVRVSLSEAAKADAMGSGWDRIALHYAVTPRALIVSLSEEVLQRALDRQAARTRGEPPPQPAAGGAAQPWLGSSLALRFAPPGLGLLDHGLRAARPSPVQQAAWSALPILNEWKRHFPDSDPVAFHARHWGVRLVCPGGGGYVWNDRFRTMESTVFGHPGDSREPEGGGGPLSVLRAADLGVTFENQGLRARAVLEIAP